jgi:hypothetical protein
MHSGRRIAAAVLTAALSMGAIGFSAGPAEANRADTSWPARQATTSTPQTAADTSWPAADTSWPDISHPPSDTSWPS